MEQDVFSSEAVNVVGAVPEDAERLKNPPLDWMTKGPEPETATCTNWAVAVSATVVGVALSCD